MTPSDPKDLQVKREPPEITSQLPPIENSTQIHREVHQLLILAFFAIFGALARVGIIKLTTYPGSYLSGVVWANFSSCLIMGLAVASENAWIYDQPKNNTKLYVGITTGFCGTFSSFSSMVLDIFLQSIDMELVSHESYPNGGYGIMECLSVVITQMGLSISGFHLGRHMIHFYDPPFHHIHTLENILAVAGVLAWIAVICLMAVSSWRAWCFTALIAPIACWMRYYVSLWLNPKNKQFPFGTFTVNIIAVTVLAVVVLLMRGKLKEGGQIVTSELSCQILQGLDDGFCGTLSTVSTFVVELHNLRLGRSYIYAGSTIILGFCIMVVIVGSYNWAVGLTSPVCS
jgi:fluoride ion exporter CrcB/FEX